MSSRPPFSLFPFLLPFLLLLSWCNLSVSAQTPGPTTDANRRQAQATRVEVAPRLDGDLSEPYWRTAPVLTDFITNSPDFGRPAAEKTEVRVVYTDEAIYIGAYMYMQDPSKIRTDLSKRDATSTADQIHVALDTYRDRQNAFRFEVTAAGVQRDLRQLPEILDVAWDAVWDARTKIHLDGWVAEIRIPFSAIRFPKKIEQMWGLQIARQTQYANEFSTWSPVDPNGGGSMPQWGDLTGLRDLDPPLRLAFSPYLAATVQRSPLQTLSEEYANSRSISGGMDVKWGISESFTLDATLIPNFGEAQSDNTVRNLSPFEIQYEERRQFFTEGTELFGKGDIFYSRRIGGVPRYFGAVQYDLRDGEVVAENPSETRLYNATKLSGRTRSKLGIGLLNAVAAPTHALIRHTPTDSTREFLTSELTNYNVLVLDQVLPHNSSIAFTNTNVLREGGGRDANVSALTWSLRDKSNTYQFSGQGRLSQVFLSEQKSNGGWGRLGLSKVSGRWGGGFYTSLADNRYDQRDLALNRRNNFFSQSGLVTYGDWQPRGKRLFTYFEFSAENTYLYKPYQWESLNLFGYGETMTKDQMRYSLVFESRPLWYYDYFEPRVPGRKYFHAPYAFISPRLTTDQRKKLFFNFIMDFGESPIPHDPYFGLSVEPTWVAGDHLRLFATLRLSKDHSNFGWVDSSNPDDIIFGRRDITSFDNQVSGEYLFNPRMSASIRVRHYWSKLFYHEYLHLNDDGTFTPTEWSQPADENLNFFNVDFVYTWQFAPGSFLNLIWKDAIFSGDAEREAGFFRNFNKTITAPQDNAVTLKLIYWLDASKWIR